MWKWALGVILVLVVVVVGGLFAYALRYPAIAPITPPAADSFAPELLEAGEVLVAMGDCAVCHTAPGGEPLAGGLPLETPFGVIHSTNITPSVETGIGAWSLDAFRRSMHEGVDRNGQYLYPAFPYDHFTRVTDGDVEAIYAYLMSQDPVEAPPPPNALGFPFNQRLLLAGWNLLFLDEGRFEPDPNQSESWNRGAYLAEGLGHCGACHSPRNAFGAVDSAQHFAGANVEGWQAFALNASSPAPVPWTADSLVGYFLDGWVEDHGVAAGPMRDVVNEMAQISEDDAYAIADYLLSFQNQDDVDARTDAALAFAEERDFGGTVTPATGPTTVSADAGIAAGQATFARVCANCHRSGTGPAPLALSSTVAGPDPSNIIHIINEGIIPPDAAYEQTMPAFGGALSDEDITNLVRFVRSHFSQGPEWPNVLERVREIRTGHDPIAGTEETGT
jgi:mono/diheme cytochrome c family protein